MEIRDLTAFIGSEIAGVTYEDLQRPEIFGLVHDALNRRELIVVRGLDITPEQQIALARKIGEPVPFHNPRYRHPRYPEILVSSNVVKADKPIGLARVGNYWHQDGSFLKDPEAYTFLHGVDVPQTSGHTLFANACDVYDRLPDKWKSTIDGRTAVHTNAKRVRVTEKHVGLSVAELRAVVEADAHFTEHPLVRRDAFTGRSYVYGTPERLHSVTGLDAHGKEAYFAQLDGLIQDPEHIYTHRWTPLDLVVWKSATTFHAATAVEPGHHRTVHRVSIAAR
ncbi:TauD/TfdA family dioxygenase [Streptomyces piniterrae]|uniref:TauD/TfdA family dioxygenase n=1 Tax=Streptomyces piniterrae TaxID=2571125 RepID=A0A4U0MW43_9ACTN|nr:TauD/TfdA family dioxygenase [Streptomyces piniterrae]TJZ45295.1 TauD/TfdA family dioxygenase [Streptomyces piniterrae]